MQQAKEVDPFAYSTMMKERREEGRSILQGDERNNLLDKAILLVKDGNELIERGCVVELKALLLKMDSLHADAMKKCKLLYYI